MEIANTPCTYTLGAFIELANQATAGTGQLVCILAKSVGAATDTTLRNCQFFSAMTTAGLVECDFSSYARKVLSSGTDYSVAYNTTTFTATITFGALVWNPAGGVTNNSPVKGVVCWRPSSGAADTAYRPLGVWDATGSAAGGTYSFTPGTLSDDA